MMQPIDEPGGVDDVRQEPEVEAGQPNRSGRLVAAVLAASAVAMTIYFATGMPGMDHGSGEPDHDSHETETVEGAP